MELQKKTPMSYNQRTEPDLSKVLVPQNLSLATFCLHFSLSRKKSHYSEWHLKMVEVTCPGLSRLRKICQLNSQSHNCLQYV